MKILNPWIKFDWSEEKNQKLKQERGVSFEMVEEAWLQGQNIIIDEHHNQGLFSHQEELLLELNGYVYSVPCVRKPGGLFLKTMFPSRKSKKKFEEK